MTNQYFWFTITPVMEKKRLNLRVKLWIECDTGDSIFGEGQMRILETIREQGSINAAAKALGMGYRSMWGRLRKMEKRLGKPLLERHKGGAEGGHSDLTPAAVEMIDRFNRLRQEIAETSETIFRKIYP
jgi:molybdate transport system regulatory protein